MQIALQKPPATKLQKKLNIMRLQPDLGAFYAIRAGNGLIQFRVHKGAMIHMQTRSENVTAVDAPLHAQKLHHIMEETTV